jgi:hypothetical protein
VFSAEEGVKPEIGILTARTQQAAPRCATAANLRFDSFIYFQSPNYRYFLVLAQSCDLARRDSKACNGRYITIAAVHKKVLDTLKALADPKPEDLQKAIADTVKSRETRKGEVLSIIANVLSDLSVPDDTVRKVRTRLENRADFAVKFR